MLLLNRQEIKINKFPNNETYINLEDIKLNKEYLSNVITLKFESNEDLFNLYLLKKELDTMNIGSISLDIPYFPYSRMDRPTEKIFSLKYVCEFINDLKFSRIFITEPHSDVVTSLLNNVMVIDYLDILFDKLCIIEEENINDPYIVYPDDGAKKRYKKELALSGYKTIIATKERDLVTGRIKKLTLDNVPQEKEFDAIIIDDLCSKGGTFIITAEKLKEIGARNIYLIVTHCENTIFDGKILETDLIKKVYTTNSILSKEHDKIFINDIIGRK